MILTNQLYIQKNILVIIYQSDHLTCLNQINHDFIYVNITYIKAILVSVITQASPFQLQTNVFILQIILKKLSLD